MVGEVRRIGVNLGGDEVKRLESKSDAPIDHTRLGCDTFPVRVLSGSSRKRRLTRLEMVKSFLANGHDEM